MTHNKITQGLSNAGSIANEMLEDNELFKNVVKLGSHGAGLVSAISTFVNMPETTNFVQKALMSCGVGWGTTVIALGATLGTTIAYGGVSAAIKKVAPESDSPLRKAFNSRGFVAAACITAAAVGGYKGHHVLTDAANDLMSQSHTSAPFAHTQQP